MRKHLLLAGAAMIACGAVTPVLAQEANTPVATAPDVAEIVVYGQGQTRQVQTINTKDMELAVPGASPIKVLAKLPSVNFQSSDPWGAYEWSTRITVRGFNQNQLGFTLDDVPLGDMSYGNYNGLHISRAISSENIGVAELSQGTGALGAASSSNLGGVIQFHSVNPSGKFGVLGIGSYGSDDTYRGFARVETGELPGGGRGYLSYGYSHADKWKGVGVQKQQQINAKFVQPVGDTATVTAWVNWSDRRENDYQDLSLWQLSRPGLGYTWDNITNNFALMSQVAAIYNANPGGDCPQVGGGTGADAYPAPIQCVDDAYAGASGLRKDTIGAGTLDWNIVPDLKLKLTAYGHHNDGQGLWYTPYVVTPGGAPMSIRTTEYSIDRWGGIGSLAYTLGMNTIEGGFWYEDNDFHQARRYYDLNATGTNRSSLSFQTNPFFTQWEWQFTTKTYQWHLQDTLQVTDAFKINVGFKALDVKIDATPVAGTAFAGSIDSKKNFLPQAGFVWRANETGEVFGDYSKNMRAFVGAATSGPFSTSPAGFAAISNTLKPETTDTFEGGYRLNTGQFQGVLAGYYVKFKNRQLSISQCAGIVGCFSGVANVGGVTSKGVEAAGTFHVTPEFSLVASYALDSSKYDDDVVDGAGVVTPTAGKTTVDAPKSIGNLSANYDNGSVFGEIGVSYMSKRYYTYLDDASVPGRALVDASIGYRFHGSDLLEGLEIQGSVTNLFDKKYISTIGSNGFVNSDPNGYFQTLQAGSPREEFITIRKQF